jgi:hypothetical protein
MDLFVDRDGPAADGHRRHKRMEIIRDLGPVQQNHRLGPRADHKLGDVPEVQVQLAQHLLVRQKAVDPLDVVLRTPPPSE